jgi:hypothetical protein
MVTIETWDLYNQFMLRGELDRFAKLLARYELFKMIVDMPGDIVEAGVLKGAGLLFWAKLIQIYNPLSRRKVVGFDTFEGYPTNSARDYDNQTAKEFTQTQISSLDLVSEKAIMEIAAAQGLAHRIELVKGDARQTTENYAMANPGFRVALLNMDFVLFEPTKAALSCLLPRVIKGGVVALDEYAVGSKGESEAVDELLHDSSIRLQSFAWAKSPTAYFVKLD